MKGTVTRKLLDFLQEIRILPSVVILCSSYSTLLQTRSTTFSILCTISASTVFVLTEAWAMSTLPSIP
jgi:hypothetical protein